MFFFKCFPGCLFQSINRIRCGVKNPVQEHDDVRGDVKGEYEIGLIAHKKENHVLIPTLAASFTPYAIYHTLAGFIPPGSAFKAKASKTEESRSANVRGASMIVYQGAEAELHDEQDRCQPKSCTRRR